MRPFAFLPIALASAISLLAMALDRPAAWAQVNPSPVADAEASTQALVDAVLVRHVLPRHAALSAATERLARTAASACRPDDPALRQAFHDAFDAWIGVSYLTFGPAEVADRQFALSFWPDTRGMTPRTLARLMADADPVARDPAAYAEMSVAARGFPALEFLLFDEALSRPADPAYHCALVRAVAADIHATASALAGDWRDRFAALMRGAVANDRFQSPEEAARALFGALDHGLEFTADLRLGRPLGSFTRPRPELAEARRAGRSLRHVILSLRALGDLAAPLAQARALDDPVFAGVSDPAGRLRVEALQQRVRALRDLVRGTLGPALGVAAGFNALDGD